MLLQASMNTFKKWFAEVVEILKTISYEPAYHWVKVQNVRKKEYTASCLIFLLLKNDKQFQSVSQSVILLCLFSMHNIWHSGNSGWKWYSHVIFGNQSRSLFHFMDFEDNPASLR